MRDGRFRSLCRRQYIFSRNTESYVYPRFGISQEFEYFSLNVRGFAALDAKVHPGLNRMSHRILLRHDPECVDRAIELCKGVALLDVETMWLNWQQFDRTERKNWEQLLLFLVHKRPHHALSFIRVLMRGSRMANRRAQAVADSLEHLAMVFLQSEIPDNLIGSKAYFMPTFYYCFRDHFFANRNVCSQALLWSVARLADSSPQLRLIYDLLIEKKAYMGYDTLLHYANKFGQFGDSEYGLRCLQRVVDVVTTPKGKADIVDRRRFRWSCALILRRIVKISNGQDYHLTTSLVAEFLKLGVKLDILLYNVIIHNAMDAGDHTTAFRVYNLLEDNRIKPDSYTLSILLHGCTVTDPVQFQDFAEFCARQAKEMNDQYLAAGYLHYLHVRHHDEEPVVLSGIIRRNYREFFRQDALLDVVSMGRSHGSTTISRDSDPFSETEADTVALEGSLMEPPSLALYIILHSAIRKSVSLGTNYVFSIYGRFKAAVLRQQHPALNELALETNIWNAFLYAFCQKQQFADASQLIKSMTDDNRALFPPPDVYSWNIFMQAFFKNDQSRAAERVYDIMRSRGVEPDQYTFGVLLSGFARKQLVEKLGGVLEHMDDEAELHPHILGELAKVHDRRRLMLELEKARIAKERKRREKLIATQKENEKVWEEPIFTIQKYVSGKKK
jgi:pentatricopeptide repeat protein